jgi:hypothetical protein
VHGACLCLKIEGLDQPGKAGIINRRKKRQQQCRFKPTCTHPGKNLTKASSLLALIDDIATILDDVAVLAKVATKKTAGVLGDDLA